MTKINENLSEIFDIQPLEENKTLPVVIDNTEDDSIEADFNFARENIKTLVEKGKLAVDDILQVAKSTDHPRAYEVASNMIKQLSDMNKDLLELQKKKRELKPVEVQNTTVNVDKAVFVGSTAELIKQIKGVN